MSSTSTRQRLLEAAVAVFATHGYAGGTVREICERAGANGAAVNYHFGGKRQLYNDAVQFAHQRQHEHTQRPADWEQLPPADRLRAYIAGMLAGMLRETEAGGLAEHRALILQELARPTEAIGELVRATIGGEFEMLQALLGELAELPPDRRQMAAFSVVGQCLFYKICAPVVERLLDDDEQQALAIHRVAEHIAQLTLAGLGVEPPIPTRPLPPTVPAES